MWLCRRCIRRSGSVVVEFVYVFNKLFNHTYLEKTVEDKFLANDRLTDDWNVSLEPFVIERKSVAFKGEHIFRSPFCYKQQQRVCQRSIQQLGNMVAHFFVVVVVVAVVKNIPK